MRTPPSGQGGSHRRVAIHPLSPPPPPPRQQLVRGVTPSRPRIKYGLAPGCLRVVLVIVAIYVVMLVALAIQMALYVVAALAALLVVRPFSRFALPALRGGVCNGNAFAETPAAGMFVLDAVPTTALIYSLSHGLATLAGAATVGGLGFRPLVRVLDGNPLPTLPLRKDVDATPSVGPDLSEPGDFGLWVGEATGALAALGHTAGLQRGSNVTLNLCDAAKNIAILRDRHRKDHPRHQPFAGPGARLRLRRPHLRRARRLSNTTRPHTPRSSRARRFNASASGNSVSTCSTALPPTPPPGSLKPRSNCSAKAKVTRPFGFRSPWHAHKPHSPSSSTSRARTRSRDSMTTSSTSAPARPRSRPPALRRSACHPHDTIPWSR